MIKLAIGGARGRMGQRVSALAASDGRFDVVAEYDKDPDSRPMAFEVLVDFAVADAIPRFVDMCRRAPAALVIGSTGHTEHHLEQIEEASAHIPVLKAANFSLGVNFLLGLLPEMARTLAHNFDIEIVETHHTQKVDAPSGTALAMLETILDATGRNQGDHVSFGRHGQVGVKSHRQVAVHAVRSGDVVGRHEVLFGGTGEVITVKHEALSRDTFAKGALEAAAWLHDKPPGSYTMRDLLAAES